MNQLALGVEKHHEIEALIDKCLVHEIVLNELGIMVGHKLKSVIPVSPVRPKGLQFFKGRFYFVDHPLNLYFGVLLFKGGKSVEHQFP